MYVKRPTCIHYFQTILKEDSSQFHHILVVWVLEVEEAMEEDVGRRAVLTFMKDLQGFCAKFVIQGINACSSPIEIGGMISL
jgi:hypothetical protein